MWDSRYSGGAIDNAIVNHPALYLRTSFPPQGNSVWDSTCSLGGSSGPRRSWTKRREAEEAAGMQVGGGVQGVRGMWQDGKGSTARRSWSW